MGVPMKLATYALVLVVVFIVAAEIGLRLRPEAGAATEPAATSSTGPTTDHGGSGEHGHADPSEGSTGDPTAAQTAVPTADPADGPAEPALPGLAAAVDGYRLTLLTPRPAAGPQTEVRLVITGPDDQPVTAYDTAHGKKLHLIVVRRDLASFQHVHPVLDSGTGVWTTTVDTSQPGTYRLFADTVPTGHDGMTLGADLAVGGDFTPAPVATGNTRTAEIDGYRVELTGRPRAGQVSTLTASVSHDGRPVTDLDPYLEAYGHLVALRQSDLAYLHVHPDGHPGDGATAAGPTISFAVDVPTAGVYRLFLDFSHGGVVRTAPFVLTVES